MVNKSGQRGTATETAVVRYLNANGFEHAERRRLRGRYDTGDVVGIPSVVIEIKGGNAARNASDGLIESWLDETETERRNANADIGVLVVARKGVGAANAGRWWAIVRDDSGFTTADGTTPLGFAPGVTIRLFLSDAVRMLRACGYGDPLEAAASTKATVETTEGGALGRAFAAHGFVDSSE